MSYMYGILAVVGWVWTGIVAIYLIVRLARERGNDIAVVNEHEKQP